MGQKENPTDHDICWSFPNCVSTLNLDDLGCKWEAPSICICLSLFLLAQLMGLSCWSKTGVGTKTPLSKLHGIILCPSFSWHRKKHDSTLHLLHQFTEWLYNIQKKNLKIIVSNVQVLKPFNSNICTHTHVLKMSRKRGKKQNKQMRLEWRAPWKNVHAKCP